MEGIKVNKEGTEPQIEGTDIEANEIKHAMTGMKKGKIAVDEGVTVEMLEVVGEFRLQKLTEISNIIFGT